VDTVSLDHGQINSHIGMIDEPMTKLIMRLHAGEDASRFPAVLRTKAGSKTDASVAASDVEPGEAGIRFTRNYVAGTRDTDGDFMGGTEMMRIVADDGNLYAAIGGLEARRRRDRLRIAIPLASSGTAGNELASFFERDRASSGSNVRDFCHMGSLRNRATFGTSPVSTPSADRRT
jgi:hypothetical protein